MPSERAPIRGQVARVLNAREIAINRGADHGVDEGMRFSVLDPAGEDIEDPETGEVLGSVYRPKVEVRIVLVREKLSIGRTFKKRRVNVGGQGIPGTGGLSGLFQPPRWETRYQTFKTDDTTLWEQIDESKSFVKSGDPVEQVLEPEELEDDGQAPIHARDVGQELSPEESATD
jgi:hypothetical protein